MKQVEIEISTVSTFEPVLIGFFQSCRTIRSEMPAFKWPNISHDDVLATEVVSARPLKTMDWNEIAQLH